MLHTGRRCKEGLRALSKILSQVKISFQVKTSTDGKEFIEITFNEVTKEFQGDQNWSGLDALSNIHAIMNEQKEDVPRCAQSIVSNTLQSPE